MKRFLLVASLVCLTLVFVACQTTTTTPTTATTETTTTETTTTESTTVDCVLHPTDASCPVLYDDLVDRVEVVTYEPLVDELLEIGIFEETNAERIADLGNPYDYNWLTMQMELTSPSGVTLVQNAFWYKQYDELWLATPIYDSEGYLLSGTESLRWLSGGISHYMVRITPDAPGDWSYVLNVIQNGVIVQIIQGEFVVEDQVSASKGILAVDPINHRQFLYTSSGETYYPMGLNLGWYGSLGSQDYYNWFKHLESVNGNFARIWMASWSFSLHKNSYDNFDLRQNMAIRLDLVFERAKEFGIMIQLTLLNHGQFSAVTNPEWSDNPYNSDNGGFLDHPIQFFTSADAKRIYQNELRYIVARYGHSQNLFAWELFNEVDWIDGYSPIAVSSWHKTMAEFIKANDPYQHLITTSYKTISSTDAYMFASLDFVSVHSYDYEDKNFYAKLISEMQYLYEKYDKPVVFGEIGIDWQSGGATYLLDATGVTIRQAAWGGLMGGGAGGASHWWWDTWFEDHEMWDRLQGASTYANRMDLALKTFQELRLMSTVDVNNSSAGILGYLVDDTVYGYLYHKSWNHWNKTPTPLENVQVTIPLTNGTYTLSVYDTESGELISTENVEITTDSVMIDCPSLEDDFAFILRPND